jgi:hypothetical protein
MQRQDQTQSLRDGEQPGGDLKGQSPVSDWYMADMVATVNYEVIPNTK